QSNAALCNVATPGAVRDGGSGRAKLGVRERREYRSRRRIYDAESATGRDVAVRESLDLANFRGGESVQHDLCGIRGGECHARQVLRAGARTRGVRGNGTGDWKVAGQHRLLAFRSRG